MMKTYGRTFICSLLALALLLAGCATTKGKVADGKYYAPLSNFTISLPRYAYLRVQDDYSDAGGQVLFFGQLGGFSSVFYERLPLEVKNIVSDPNRRDAMYRLYLREQAMPNVFRRVSPRSSLLHEEALGEGAERAYFGVVVVPEASGVFDVKANRRLDSVRGLLIFNEGDFIYMLTEETGHTTEWRSVIDSLRETRKSMTFSR